MSTSYGVTMRDILAARQRILTDIRPTPLTLSPSLSERAGASVYLKREHLQITGSFKLRGAANALRCLSTEEKRRGVVGVSTGNYGRALAHAAALQGIRCCICMSELVPENKVSAVRATGAEVRIIGRSQDEATEEADRLVSEDGMIMLPPFDHPDVIAGQGTLGLELMMEAPDIRTILVPVSGGGLAAGVALAAKTIDSDIRVIGLTMDRGAAMFESLRAGRPVAVTEYESLADSLGGGIGLGNQYTFPLVRDLVDGIRLLSEDEIAAGIRHAYREEGEVIEGGAAVGISALLTDTFSVQGPVAVLVTGANIDRSRHHTIVA